MTVLIPLKQWLHIEVQSVETSLKIHPTTRRLHHKRPQGKGKCKGHPTTGHEGPDGEQMYSSTLPSTSALDGGRWSTPLPGRFTPGERPGTHCIGDWVGPRAGLDRCGKSRPPPVLDPRTVQPVASRYTDWAIPASQKTTRVFYNDNFQTNSPEKCSIM